MTSDLQTDFKRSSPHINREDSILSKGSISSLFKKSFDSPWSSGPGGTYTPKPEKTFAFIETILATLSDMHIKYSMMTSSEECGVEHQDYNEICLKLDDRMLLIQNLKSFYMSLTENRQAEFDKIESKIKSILSSKSSRKSFDIEDNEAYLQICRELLVVESKLERCSGKLQFQIMELDFIGKISPLDQYELSIRLNETKFKTRIKIERNGYQVWDCRTFCINPMIDDYMYIKFSELRPLNKSIVLTEKKLPFINNLIKAEPSIFTLWLSPVGTIKLKVIVQWNAALEDTTLNTYLTGVEAKLLDNSVKNDTFVHIRSATTSHKYVNAHLSSNIETLFRSHRVMESVRSNSMSNIVEDVEAEATGKKVSIGIQHGSLINETINEVINVTPDMEEPHVQTRSDIKIDIVDEDEVKIQEERRNRKHVLRKERVFINVISDKESCLDQEIDTNYTEEHDTVENTMSFKDAPPAHIKDIATGYEAIDSPIIAIHEASIGPEDDGNEVKPLEIPENQAGSHGDKSISQDDPTFVEGEANLSVENIEEEEDPELSSKRKDDHSLDISEEIAENIGGHPINDAIGASIGAEDNKSKDESAAIDQAEINVCSTVIDNKENNDSKVDFDNRVPRSSDIVIDTMEPRTSSASIGHAEDNEPRVDLVTMEPSTSNAVFGHAEDNIPRVDLDSTEPRTSSASIGHAEDSEHKVDLVTMEPCTSNAVNCHAEDNVPRVDLDSTEPRTSSASIGHAEDSEPKVDLVTIEPKTPNATISQTEDNDPRVDLDRTELRKSSVTIDDEADENSQVIHNTVLYVPLGNIEAGDSNVLIKGIPIRDKCDNSESIYGSPE